MRVLVLWTYQSSYAEAGVRAIAAAGHEVTVLYAVDWGHPRLAASPEVPGVSRVFAKNERIPKSLWSLQWDAAFICGWHIRSYRNFAAKRPGIPRILYFDNQFMGGIKQQAFTLLGPAHLRRLFDCAFVPGERQANYAKKLGFPTNRIVEGGICFDDSVFQPARSESRVDGDFLFAGRLAPEKNVQALVAGYSQFASRWRGDRRLPRLLLAGPSHGLQVTGTRDVVVLGNQSPSSTAKHMQDARCVVLPSLFEPWGVSLMEAAATGAPLVASSAVGAASSLISSTNGRVLKDADADGIALVLSEVASWDKERLEKAHVASIAASDQYRPARWAQRLLAAIASIQSS